MKTRILSLMFLACALVMTACISTSKSFQLGTSQAGPLFAEELVDYVNGDATISATVKADRLAAVSAFTDATKTTQAIDSDVVESTWAPVRTLYISYINGDATLTAADKALRLTTVTKFDQLLVDEKTRRHAAGH